MQSFEKLHCVSRHRNTSTYRKVTHKDIEKRNWSTAKSKHPKSEHPKSSKDSLPYSQAIRIKWICSNQVDLNNSLKEMENNLVKQGYQSLLTNEHLEKIRLLNRIDLIAEKDTQQKSDRIPLVIAYNQFLPLPKPLGKIGISYR